MKTPVTMDELRREMDEQGVSLPISDDTSVLSESVKLGSLTTPNRFVALPMEGCDSEPNGAPGELTFRRYERMAAGGAGIIWVEACAVQNEGRSNPRSLCLHDANLAGFKALVDRIRRAGLKAMEHDVICILQITHSGRYSKPYGTPTPLLVRHCPDLDAAQQLAGDHPLASDEQLDGVRDVFVDAAELAKAAGFDGVDIKSCHGYFISSLLAAHDRPGRYGGTYENRIRFLKETISSIKERLPSLLVTTRMNVFDGMPYPYGFGTSGLDGGIPDMKEPTQLAHDLAALGVPMLNISMGYPRFDAHYGRPGADDRQEHPLSGISRFTGLVKKIQESVPDTPTVTGALAWLGQHMPAVAAGLVESGSCQLIGQGRGSIAYPNSVRDILQKGTLSEEKCCITCSMCARLLRDGKYSGCVVRDKSVYGTTKG